jgi:hypothetical protein
MFTGILFTSLVPAAIAQPMCFPTAGGVPGQPGVPNWWNEAPPALTDDPRWRGCMQVGHNGDAAEARALYQIDGADKYLVLSWNVKSDPGFAGDPGATPSTGTPFDAVFVGLYNEDTVTPANSKGLLIRAWRRATTSTTSGPSGSAYDIKVKYLDSTTAGGWSDLTTAPPVPIWMTTDGRLDTTCDGGAPPTCDKWVMRMRLKLNAAGTTSATGASDPVDGIPVGTTFKMFWDFQVENAGLAAHYKWPTTLADVDESAAPPTYPDVSTWGQFQIGTSPPCMSGISIASSQIDVVTTPPTGQPHRISVSGSNVFHARPTNGSGASLGAGAIKAKFRVADWGSAVGDSPSWRTVPGCDAATGTGASVGIGGQWDLNCNWSLSAEDKCAYDPANFTCTPSVASRHNHQCVLVELSTTSVPLYFSTASTYRNMDFVPASRFERDARVDIAGLAGLGGGATTRDVYLYVETRNMPATIDDKPAEQPQGENGGEAPANRLNADFRKRLEIPEGRPIDAKTSERLQAAVAAGAITHDDVAKIMPTYIVHVWHDTGRKTKTGTPIIESQPSFGYFVSHDGDLTGWKHSIQGKGVTLSPVPNSRNFYKLAVAEGGSAVVTTVIESVEKQTTPPPVPPKIPWWVWLVFVLILIIVIYLVRRPRNTSPV